jgi:hypothetical protein
MFLAGLEVTGFLFRNIYTPDGSRVSQAFPFDTLQTPTD